MSDTDLRLTLGLQLLLQIPHLLLVILNQVDKLEDLLAWLLVSGLQMLNLILTAPNLLPQVLVLGPHHRLLPGVCLLTWHLITEHHPTVNNVLLERVRGEHGILLGAADHYRGRVPARAPSLRLLWRRTLGLHVIIIQLDNVAREYDFQLAMNDLTHLFVGL